MGKGVGWVEVFEVLSFFFYPLLLLSVSRLLLSFKLTWVSPTSGRKRRRLPVGRGRVETASSSLARLLLVEVSSSSGGGGEEEEKPAGQEAATTTTGRGRDRDRIDETAGSRLLSRANAGAHGAPLELFIGRDETGVLADAMARGRGCMAGRKRGEEGGVGEWALSLKRRENDDDDDKMTFTFLLFSSTELLPGKKKQ